MEHTLNHGMCRCCASEGMFKNFSATYQWMGADEVYSDMLKECFDIALTHAEDCNNGGICEVCITQLRNASNFKKQVLQTEEQFKKMVQDNLFKTNIVKVENSKDEDELESEPDNLSDPDYSGTEFEVPVKEEVIEPKTRKRAAKASTSSAKKAKTEDGEPSRTRARHSIKTEDGFQTIGSWKEIEVNNKPKKGGELQKHRANMREVLNHSNATPIRCRGGVGYACCFCTEQFPDPADLKTHTINTHDEKSKNNFMKGKDMYKFHVKLDITDLKCNICDANMQTLEQLIEHLKRVHKKNMHMDIKNQVLPFKFDSEHLRCFICLNVFHKFKMLLEHMNTHCRNYICEVCDAGFVSRAILAQHGQSHKLGQFHCDLCEKVFDTFRKKRSHEKCVHTPTKALNKCGYCNEKFKDYRRKEKHLAEVHGIKAKSLKCQACDKTFINQKDYTVHIKRQHLMDRRYKCTECEMSFFSLSELKNHVVKHTGMRTFECEVCHKAYGRKKTLNEHMRIHADDRRFKCEHCGQAFVQKCSWRGHMRSKHGEQV